MGTACKKIHIVATVAFVTFCGNVAIASDSLPSTRVTAQDLTAFGYRKGIDRIAQHSELRFLSDKQLLITINPYELDATLRPPGTVIVLDVASSTVIKSIKIAMDPLEDSDVPYDKLRIPKGGSGSEMLTLSEDSKSNLLAKMQAGGVAYRIDRHLIPGFQRNEAKAVLSAGSPLLGLSWSNNSFLQLIKPLACIDECDPPAIQRFLILDEATGKPFQYFHWDPRPWNDEVVPALSPDGKLAAIIRHGSVEVYCLTDCSVGRHPPASN